MVAWGDELWWKMRLKRYSGVRQRSGIWNFDWRCWAPGKVFKQWCHGPICALSSYSDGSMGEDWRLWRQETYLYQLSPLAFCKSKLGKRQRQYKRRDGFEQYLTGRIRHRNWLDRGITNEWGKKEVVQVLAGRDLYTLSLISNKYQVYPESKWKYKSEDQAESMTSVGDVTSAANSTAVSWLPL